MTTVRSSSRRRLRVRMTLRLACLSVLSTALVSCTPSTEPLPADDAAALHVNGIAVTVAEYERCMRDALPGTISDAERVGQGNDLTGASVDGRPALEELRERGARACADDVVRRGLGVELGAIDDPSRAASVQRWHLHNDERRARADAGEIVYGPVELDYQDFDAIEQAEFATAVELPMVDALLADPRALDAAVLELTGDNAPSDERERTIAAQAVAREQVERRLSEASAAARLTYADWLDEVAVGSIIER